MAARFGLGLARAQGAPHPAGEDPTGFGPGLAQAQGERARRPLPPPGRGLEAHGGVILGLR